VVFFLGSELGTSVAIETQKGQLMPVQACSPLLNPVEAARLLKVSLSWLAKARMTGDGPPYIRIGRSIRYSDAVLVQWLKSRQRLSTSER
jgi:hypothetical protein